MEVGGLTREITKWNLGNVIVVHPHPSHNKFQMDGILVSGRSCNLNYLVV